MSKYDYDRFLDMALKKGVKVEQFFSDLLTVALKTMPEVVPIPNMVCTTKKKWKTIQTPPNPHQIPTESQVAERAVSRIT